MKDLRIDGINEVLNSGNMEIVKKIAERVSKAFEYQRKVESRIVEKLKEELGEIEIREMVRYQEGTAIATDGNAAVIYSFYPQELLELKELAKGEFNTKGYLVSVKREGKREVYNAVIEADGWDHERNKVEVRLVKVGGADRIEKRSILNEGEETGAWLYPESEEEKDPETWEVIERLMREYGI